MPTSDIEHKGATVRVHYPEVYDGRTVVKRLLDEADAADVGLLGSAAVLRDAAAAIVHRDIEIARLKMLLARLGGTP